jgi:hypothetical protein
MNHVWPNVTDLAHVAKPLYIFQCYQLLLVSLKKEKKLPSTVSLAAIEINLINYGVYKKHR